MDQPGRRGFNVTGPLGQLKWIQSLWGVNHSEFHLWLKRVSKKTAPKQTPAPLPCGTSIRIIRRLTIATTMFRSHELPNGQTLPLCLLFWCAPHAANDAQVGLSTGLGHCVGDQVCQIQIGFAGRRVNGLHLGQRSKVGHW